VAPAFTASSDFAIDKPAGTPCPNLGDGFLCTIHDRLRPAGFPGCVVYDCFGAGQKVTGVTYAGRDWRSEPAIADEMFAVFAVVRDLHEMLWYLAAARALPAAAPLDAELRRAQEATDDLTRAAPVDLRRLDVDAHRGTVAALLRDVSARARAGVRRAPVHRGADLVGADLRDTRLRGADMRGALLIGADLRRADLDLADLTGADLRGADLRGARLAGALFVTPSQIEAARGDAATTLPPGAPRPEHWPPR